jgi:nucleotide-binding universal stress UspA family protein
MDMDTVIGSVLVPLDGSTLAAAALPVGQAIAGRAACALHLVRVLDHGVPAETERRAEQALRDAAASATPTAQPHLRLGEPADQILAAAEALPQPLIVMTTHGRTGMGRWAFGSVADRVVRGGEAPVLLLRSGTTSAEPAGFQRLLVPLDGSVLAETALPPALALARAFDAELHLARVAETANIFLAMGIGAAPLPADVVNTFVDEQYREVTDYLEPIAARARSGGVATTAAVLDGVPVEALLGYVAARAIDLVVLATHGRGGVNRLVLGSVAERLLRLAQVPILMVPAAAVAELAVAPGIATG